VPFGARFGYSETELVEDRELNARLMDEYARAYGHQPRGPWILIVHADGRSEFFSFDDADEMWCCKRQDSIRAQLESEIAQARVQGRPLLELPPLQAPTR
jgi:hypothetical protein